MGPRNQSKIRRVVEKNMTHLQEQLVSSNTDKHFFKDIVIDTINKKNNISTNSDENKVIHQLLLTYRNQYNDKSTGPYAKYTSVSALTDAFRSTVVNKITVDVFIYSCKYVCIILYIKVYNCIVLDYIEVLIIKYPT